jgi:hypothetical protein
VKIIQQLKPLRHHFESPQKIAENPHTFLAMALFFVPYCRTVEVLIGHWGMFVGSQCYFLPWELFTEPLCLEREKRIHESPIPVSTGITASP